MKSRNKKIFLSYFSSKLIEAGDSLYYRVLENELSDCQTVLDVGCGSNSPLLKIKKSFWSEGVDIHKPSIFKSKKKRSHDSYKIADIRNLDKIYRQKSFDAVVALDLIEHLEYQEGEKLLNSLEKIAKKKVIILTPNGFLPQDGYGNNPYQIHKSGWTVKDFLKYGFTYYGLRGLKGIRGEQGTIKYRPWFFWGLIAVITEYLTFYFPKLAAQIFAVKRLNRR